MTTFFSYPIIMMDLYSAVQNLEPSSRKLILDAFQQLEQDLEEITEAKYPSNSSKFITSYDDKFFTKETKQ
ncbi:MAG: hypothetical protein CL889_03125 [Dehalococcoidia bacterium]|nr:hypothetical protein [Dehalococcoidia bacterium]